MLEFPPRIDVARTLVFLPGFMTAPQSYSTLLRPVADAGVHVEGLTLRTPTLDDVFLHITGGRLQVGEE